MSTRSRSAIRHAIVVSTAAATVALLASSGFGFSQEDEGDSQADSVLFEILPEETPDDLSTSSFEDLDGNWEEWSTETADLVGELYEEGSLSDEERRELLKKLRTKLGTMDTAIADAKYRSLHKPLRRLAADLRRRLDLIDALVEVVQQPPLEIPGAVGDQSRSDLREAINATEGFLAGISNPEPWREFAHLDELKSGLDSSAADESFRETLKQVVVNLTKTDDSSADQQRFIERNPLQTLADACSDHLVFLETTTPAKLQTAYLKRLVQALENYDANLRRRDARLIRRYRRLLSKLSPTAASRIAGVIDQQIDGDNLKIAIAGPLVTDMIKDARTENGSVKDCILGAYVTGCQVSHVTVSAALVPNSAQAQLQIMIAGTVCANTQGRKKPATIYTRGNHSFYGRKNVYFNGEKFSTSETVLNVNTNNTTVGVTTDYSWIPIVGCFADKMAREEAAKKKGESEYIAAWKLKNRVLPRFDKEVGEQFDTANSEIDKAVGRLRSNGLYPSSVRTSSSNSHIHLDARANNDYQVAGASTAVSLLPQKGVAIQIHESLINNALDKLPIAGRSLTEAELTTELQLAFSEMLGRPINFGGGNRFRTVPDDPEEDSEDNGLQLPSGDDDTAAVRRLSVEPASYRQDDNDAEGDKKKEQPTFVFDSTDPIRVRLTDDAFVVILRTGVRQDGEREIPLQEITIPIGFKVAGTTLTLEAGEARIRALKRGGGPAFAIAAQIRRIIEARMPKRETDLVFNTNVQGKAMSFVARQFAAADGWLNIVLEPSDATAVPQQVLPPAAPPADPALQGIVPVQPGELAVPPSVQETAQPTEGEAPVETTTNGAPNSPVLLKPVREQESLPTINPN